MNYQEMYTKETGMNPVYTFQEYGGGPFHEAGLTEEYTKWLEKQITILTNNGKPIHQAKSYTRDELYHLCKVAYRYGAQNSEDATIERFDELMNKTLD